MLLLELLIAFVAGSLMGGVVAWFAARRKSQGRERILARAFHALQNRDYARALLALEVEAAPKTASPSARHLQPWGENIETVESSSKRPAASSSSLESTLRQAIGKLESSEHETQVARRELEDVLASLQDAVLVVDGEARLRFLNASAQRFFNVQVEDVLGAQLLEALPSFGLEAAVRDALQDGRHHSAELSLYAPSANGAADGMARSLHAWGDGGRREVLLRVAPVRQGDGSVSGAVAIVQDLTEMRRLERVRRDFVANASHELRTPIANIRAVAETTLDAADDPDLVRRFLPQLVTEAERLSRLVSDLLDLARADSTAEMPLSPVDLNKVVCDVARRLNDKAASENITVRCETDENGWVVGDAAGLEQVAFNLLDNALMYTPPGGSIIMRVRRDTTIEKTDGQSTGENHSDPAPSVTLSVIDSGIGIPTADLPRIFERFYRVDKARSRSQGGTGLGLAIVKHIVERHDGHVRVESEVGRGTTFIVTLPGA